jgi:hypothetical protein
MCTHMSTAYARTPGVASTSLQRCTARTLDASTSEADAVAQYEPCSSNLQELDGALGLVSRGSLESITVRIQQHFSQTREHHFSRGLCAENVRSQTQPTRPERLSRARRSITIPLCTSHARKACFMHSTNSTGLTLTSHFPTSPIERGTMVRLRWSDSKPLVCEVRMHLRLHYPLRG